MPTYVTIDVFFLAIHARETGSNKQTASKSCALSLVRQLFHLGVIEAYTGQAKKKDNASLMTPYEVSLDPTLIGNIRDVLQEIGVTPNTVVCIEMSSNVSLSRNLETFCGFRKRIIILPKRCRY